MEIVFVLVVFVIFCSWGVWLISGAVLWLWKRWLDHKDWLLGPFLSWTGLDKKRRPKL